MTRLSIWIRNINFSQIFISSYRAIPTAPISLLLLLLHYFEPDSPALGATVWDQIFKGTQLICVYVGVGVVYVCTHLHWLFRNNFLKKLYFNNALLPLTIQETRREIGAKKNQIRRVARPTVLGITKLKIKEKPCPSMYLCNCEDQQVLATHQLDQISAVILSWVLMLQLGRPLKNLLEMFLHAIISKSV